MIRHERLVVVLHREKGAYQELYLYFLFYELFHKLGWT